MANVTTNTRLLAGNKRTIQYIVIDSDGTEATDLVLYDSSAVATALGIPNPLDCTIMAIKYCITTATAVTAELQFDATTDVLAIPLILNEMVDIDFSSFGGLTNPAGAGITGDITLTTTALGAGDNIFMVLEVKPN